MAILPGSSDTSYDAADNRTGLEDSSGTTTTYTYDAANRLLTAEDASGVTTYTYDANGNQLSIEVPSGDVTTNTWDGENRLVQVEQTNSAIVANAYNADGLRVEKGDGPQVTRYIYDANNLPMETADLGSDRR